MVLLISYECGSVLGVCAVAAQFLFIFIITFTYLVYRYSQNDWHLLKQCESRGFITEMECTFDK